MAKGIIQGIVDKQSLNKNNENIMTNPKENIEIKKYKDIQIEWIKNLIIKEN